MSSRRPVPSLSSAPQLPGGIRSGRPPRPAARGGRVLVALSLACILGLSTAQAQNTGTDIPALIVAGQWAQARSVVEQQLQSRPKDAQLLLYKGVIQRESGQLREAQATFTQLTIDQPRLPEAWNNLAAVHAAQGQFELARVALEKALHTHPSYATAYGNLGAVYARLASQAYSRALLIDAEGAVPNAKPSPQQQAANDALKLSLQQPMQLALLREVRELPATPAPLPTPAPVVTAAAPPPSPPAPQAAVAAPAPVAPPPAASAPAPVVSSALPAPTPVPPPATPAPATTASSRPTPATPPRDTAPQAAAASEPTTPASTSEEQAVDQAVRAWAQAWSDRDMARYLAAYAADFDTGGQNRSAWEQGRRARIVSKRNISVDVQNLRITVSGSRAFARFLQDYRADTLAVVNSKTLELTRTADRWLIVKESAGN
jgi:tetratricopeptide (TPR) repeat protein